MKTQETKTRGGVNDPNLKRKVLLEVDNKELEHIAKVIASKLNSEGTCLVKNMLKVTVKKSNRKQRFDYKEQAWKDVDQKYIISFNVHKKFKDLILNEYTKLNNPSI